MCLSSGLQTVQQNCRISRLERPLEVSCPSLCSKQVQLAQAAQGFALGAVFLYTKGEEITPGNVDQTVHEM